MRYPITLIPGLPVTPDIGIGVSLLPIVIAPAPPTAPAPSGPPTDAGATEAYWALHPFTGLGDDVLSVRRGGAFSDSVSTPLGAFIEPVGVYVPDLKSLVCAVVRNVPDGSSVTWAVSDPVALTGSAMTFTRSGDAQIDISFSTEYMYAISTQGNLLVANFTRDFHYSWGAWSLEPLSVIASVDGVPLRTLTLNVSALANSGA